jgi:hypothetical protein
LRDRTDGKYRKEGLHSPTGLTGEQILIPKNCEVDNCGNYSGQGQKEYEEAGVQNPSDVKRNIIESWSPLGRNKRCVWKISTKGVKEAHFALFPEELVRPMILAGVPEYQCKKCGKPREKIYNSAYDKEKKNMSKYKKKLIELSDCGCEAGWESGSVLDPFVGSGTTIRVAEKLGRRGFGCDLGYQEISSQRTINIQKEWG